MKANIAELSRKYHGAKIGKIFQSHGSIILIDYYCEKDWVLNITFYYCYWRLEKDGELIIDSDEDFKHQDKYKEKLGHLVGECLYSIGFDGEDFDICFSNGYNISVTDDLEGTIYRPEYKLVVFNDILENKSLSYSPAKGFEVGIYDPKRGFAK